MKIVFVHISDIHITEDFNVNSSKIDRLICAIRSKLIKADECIVICSGDVTKTAHINEYKVARKYFGKIISKIGMKIDKFVHLFIVPGNHDLSLQEDSRTSKDIIDYYKSKDFNECYYNELLKNKNFFNYANSKNCFVNSQIVDKIIIDKLEIQVNLINTSPFSTMKSNDNDKILHYLPSDQIKKLQKENDKYLCISILHHSTEWFNSKTQVELEQVLYNNTDILFVGHEHNINYERTKRLGTKEIHVSRGGEYSGSYTKNSSFSIFTYDTSNLEIEESIFKWDYTNNVFCETNVSNSKLKEKAIIDNKSEFTKEFYKDSQGLTKSLLDYFVFPELLKRTNEYECNYEEGVLSEEQLYEAINKNNIVNIIALPDHGKTTLLKYLYSYFLRNGKVPLYMLKGNYISKIDRIIEYLFRDQYSDNLADYNKFKQLDSSKKVFIIDDFDKLNSDIQRKKLLEVLKDDFSTIIISSNKSNITDVLSNIEQTAYNKYSIKTFEINRFYKRKRSELIKKICSLDSGFDRNLIDNIIEIIDSMVDTKTDMFILSPSSLIQYIKYFMSIDLANNKDDAIFIDILQNNIINSMREHIKDSDIKEYLNQLEDIAYHMHFHKQPIISLEDIHKSIQQYNETMNMKMITNIFISRLLDSNILSSTEQNYYTFKNKNYFAYFVAKRIDKNLRSAEEFEDIKRNKEDLKNLAENICFNINDRILMFLSYIKNNTRFIINLCNELPTMLKDYEPIDYKNYNIKFLERASYKGKLKYPTKKEKENLDIAKEKTEAFKKDTEDEISFLNDYDYSQEDISKFPNNINRAIKYLEIIAKSFTSQYSDLDKEKKEIVCKTLYLMPDKILYAILKPLDEKFYDFVDYMHELVNNLLEKKARDENKKHVPKTKQEAEELLIDTSRGIILSLYDQIAFDSATPKTIDLLTSYSTSKISNEIQSLMMLSNSKSTIEFVDESILLLEKYSKNPLIQTFIKLIVRAYVIRKPEISHRYTDKICSKILPSSSKKDLIVIRNKE